MKQLVTAISTAISEGFKWLRQHTKTAPRRKREACIEAAENFIRVYYKSGEFKGISNKRKKQLLTHYSKRFFHYN